MHTDKLSYRKAFETYLRKGIPIELSLKQSRTTTHYVWRTRQDSKVRSRHAVNHGKVFAWDMPPPTGHPGEEYGCRCRAEPYTPNVSDHMSITLTGVSDSGSEWSIPDFVEHYFLGKGKGVILREVGHLVKVVDSYMEQAEEALKGQIADEARKNIGSAFNDVFKNSYDVKDAVFVLGRTTVGGAFSGTSTLKRGILSIEGDLTFYQKDRFADSVDFYNLVERDIEIFGEPYSITDEWRGSFNGQVLAERSRSRYKHNKRK